MFDVDLIQYLMHNAVYCLHMVDKETTIHLRRVTYKLINNTVSGKLPQKIFVRETISVISVGH